jgi:hypothetical protein
MIVRDPTLFERLDDPVRGIAVSAGRVTVIRLQNIDQFGGGALRVKGRRDFAQTIHDDYGRAVGRAFFVSDREHHTVVGAARAVDETAVDYARARGTLVYAPIDAAFDDWPADEVGDVLAPD